MTVQGCGLGVMTGAGLWFGCVMTGVGFGCVMMEGCGLGVS